MLVKGIMTQMSGSIGGITAAHNSSGLYLRARSIPVNPNTAQQQAARNAMSVSVNRWTEELTIAERAAWDVYAKNVPVTNRVGDSINISGQNWYVACNAPRLQAALDPVDAGPVLFNRGEQDETITITASESGGFVVVTFDDTQAWLDEDGSAMLIYISRPYNPSVNFFKGPFRLATAVEGDSVTPPTSPAAVTPPFPLTAGQAVSVDVAVTRADGRLTTRQSFRVLVSA